MPERTRGRIVSGASEEAPIVSHAGRAPPARRYTGPRMKRIVILISGRGSNMEAIVDRCRGDGWPADVVAVLANRADAGGLAWASARGIATAVVDHRAFAERADFDAALAETIDGHRPDLVLL